MGPHTTLKCNNPSQVFCIVCCTSLGIRSIGTQTEKHIHLQAIAHSGETAITPATR